MNHSPRLAGHVQLPTGEKNPRKRRNAPTNAVPAGCVSAYPCGFQPSGLFPSQVGGRVRGRAVGAGPLWRERTPSASSLYRKNVQGQQNGLDDLRKGLPRMTFDDLIPRARADGTTNRKLTLVSRH